MLLREVRGEIQRRHIQDSQTALEEAMAGSPALDACRLRQGIKTGAWLTVLLSTVNGTDLGSQEWRYILFL